VAGFAPQAANAAQKKAPEVSVCLRNSGVGTFRFSVNGGKSFGLNGSCATLKGRAGLNKVTELWAPARYSKVKSISVSPSKTVVKRSVKTATVSLRLKSGVKARFGYTNSKVRATGTGYIELCKYGYENNKWTQGDFTFYISGVSKPVTVLAGTCAAPVAVPAGSVTITEKEPAHFVLKKVTTDPSTALTSVNYSGASATVMVPSGVNVETSFYNEPQLGVVKVCKTLAANAASLVGDTFYFDVTWTFTAPSGMAMSGKGLASVTAASTTGVTVCKPFATLPVGTYVSITEDMSLSPPDITSTVTGIVPPSANAGSTSTMANLIVAPGATDAMFTDGALGYIEVCKNPLQSYGQDKGAGNQPFPYSIDNGPVFWVNAGSCSAPMQVAVGDHTVTEGLNKYFYLTNVSTVAADDPTGARLLSGPTANPAKVSVPYGGVANETVVTFTNHTQGAQIKVCAEQTSPDANLGGVTFDVNGRTSNGVSISAVLTLYPSTSNPTGLVCGNLTPIFDAINGSSNSPVTFTLTETAGSGVPVGTDIANVIYQGNGSGPSPDSFPQALGTTFSFTAGVGENVVTFVNGRTSGGSGSSSRLIS
jgi:hypothetical protein